MICQDRLLPSLLALFLVCVALLTPPFAFAQPDLVSYQGELRDGETAYGGSSADFKFAIVDIQSDATLWSNDGTSVDGSEPTAFVTLAVDGGIFGTLLGEAPMSVLTPDLIAENENAALRVWVDTGQGFEQLPDQTLASSPFALHAETAERSASDFEVAGELQLSPSGVRFDDGSVQTTASAGGGSDSDWTIDEPNVYRLGGSVGVGTSVPARTLHLVDSEAAVRLDQESDSTSYLEVRDASPTYSTIRKFTSSGDALIDMDPLALDGVSNAIVRLFRSSNTTGEKALQLMKGDGSATADAQIGVDGKETYFNGGGNVGIGTATPTSELHVIGRVFSVDLQASQDLTAGGNVVAGGIVRGDEHLSAGNGVSLDGDVLIRLRSEREWQFRQKSEGATAALELVSVGGGGNKNFEITTGGTFIVNATTRTNVLEITGGSDLGRAL